MVHIALMTSLYYILFPFETNYHNTIFFSVYQLSITIMIKMLLVCKVWWITRRSLTGWVCMMCLSQISWWKNATSVQSLMNYKRSLTGWVCMMCLSQISWFKWFSSALTSLILATISSTAALNGSIMVRHGWSKYSWFLTVAARLLWTLVLLICLPDHELQVIPALLVAVPDENTGHFLLQDQSLRPFLDRFGFKI